MSILIIAGRPYERSRTAALLSAAGQHLDFRGAQGEPLRMLDLPAQVLLLADFGHPAVMSPNVQVAKADIVVVATSLYKAVYSEVLKGKTVLPLLTGGRPHQMLAVDNELRPELLRRGLFRNEYSGHTLREHLGLTRPLHPRAKALL